MASGKKDACYHKVKSRYKVWPSAYASGALVKCRKVGAKNWGNKSRQKKAKGGEMKGYGAARTSGMGLQDEQLVPGKSLDYYKDIM